MNRPRSLSTVIWSLTLLALAACAGSSAIERSYNYARLGDYHHAFEVLDRELEKQRKDGSVSPRLERAHGLMRREFLRDRAQRHIFHEEEDKALDDLAELEAIDPDNESLPDLREMALIKKARRIVLSADELLAQQEFALAMEGYLESQRLVPGFAPANDGIERVRDEMERLSSRAQQQFLQAVRKVPEFRHIEVAWHADAVIHNTPDPDDKKRTDAEELRRNAHQESAVETFRRAKECEDSDKFGAALVLYKEALALDPEMSGAQQAIDRMKSELQASTLLEKAMLEMRTGKFAEAEAKLEEAFELSRLMRGAISEQMIMARERKAMKGFQDARDLKVMGKKIAAKVAFEKLLASWPVSLTEERAQIETDIVNLQTDIDGAAEEWQAAEEAEAKGDLEAALDHFTSSRQFFEEWRDVDAQIQRVKAKIAARKPAAGEGGADGN